MTLTLKSVLVGLVVASLTTSAIVTTAGAATVTDGHEEEHAVEHDTHANAASNAQEENTTTTTTTDQETDELSDEQRQAIASGVRAGIDELDRIGITVSQQEQQAVIRAAVEGADPRANSIVLEEAAAGIAYGVLGEGATQAQLHAAVRGAMAGTSRAAVEQQNASQLEIVYVVNEVASGAARGAVIGGVQNENVSEDVIEAAASGTAAGAVDGAMTNFNATLGDIWFVTHKTSWATTNLAVENPQLTADDLERTAYTFARTSLLELPVGPPETGGTSA